MESGNSKRFHRETKKLERGGVRYLKGDPFIKARKQYGNVCGILRGNDFRSKFLYSAKLLNMCISRIKSLFKHASSQKNLGRSWRMYPGTMRMSKRKIWYPRNKVFNIRKSEESSQENGKRRS